MINTKKFNNFMGVIRPKLYSEQFLCFPIYKQIAVLLFQIVEAASISSQVIFLLSLMISIRFGKQEGPKKIKPQKPEQPFRFKTYSCEDEKRWTTLDRALTNRYHQVYGQSGNKTVLTQNLTNPESLNSHRSIGLDVEMKNTVARFQIKRKYLSFNPEKTEKRSLTSLRTLYPASLSGQKKMKTERMPLLEPQADRNKETSLSGTYYVAKNTNMYKKFRQILYKKKGKKNSTNPELEVKPKFREKKLKLPKTQKMERIQPRGIGARRKGMGFSSIQEEEQGFRPWSGKQQDF